jgi:hypothetical protein
MSVRKTVVIYYTYVSGVEPAALWPDMTSVVSTAEVTDVE